MTAGLPSPDFSSPNQSPSASVVNPTQPTNVLFSNVANGVANHLPQTWGGTPIRNFFGVTPAYAAGPSVLGTSTSSPANPTNSTPTNYSANVNYSPNNSSSMPSQLQQLQAIGSQRNPYQETQYQQLMSQYMASQQNSAASQASANISAATNMYNNLRAQLETQRPVLESAYNKGSADLQNQLDLGQQQGQANSAQLTSAYNAGMGTLGQNYQTSQAENRELARAMGGNGSDYAMLQNKTNNSYQNNQFQTFNDYSTRLNQIQQGMQSLQQWGAAQKDQLATQYQQGINQLVLNENMTDFSKAQAIQQIQSDYQKNLAGISSVVMQLGGQLAIAQNQTQQIMAMYGHATQDYNPLSGLGGMFFGAAGQQAPTVDTSGGITQPNKTAGGINNQNGAASF